MKTKQNMQRRIIGASALLMLLFCTNIIQAQVSKTVNVVTAGTLNGLLTATEKATVTDLTIIGEIDARDVKCMRDNMAILANIDMSKTIIVAYSGSGGTLSGSNSYVANLMPDFSFCNNNTWIGDTIINSVIFPNGIYGIGNKAFNGCTGLTSITLPSSLLSCGDDAFNYCIELSVIKSINPTPPGYIGTAFSSVDFPHCTLIVPDSSVASYQASSYWNTCGQIIGGGHSVLAKANNYFLGKITGLQNKFYSIGDTVTITASPIVANSHFFYWKSGDSIISTNPIISMTIGQDTSIVAIFRQEVSINLVTAGTFSSPANVYKLTLTGNIDARDIHYIRTYMEELTDLDLSGTTIVEYDGFNGIDYGNPKYYPANFIPDYSFHDANVSIQIKPDFLSIVLPNNLDSIGTSALSSLKRINTIVLPNSLISIGGWAFSNCSNLSTIIFPSTLKKIENDAFDGCTSLTHITLPSNLEELQSGAFFKTNIDTIVLPNSLTRIEEYMFGHCQNLSSIQMPNTVTSIGNFSFGFCINLSTITLPSSLTEIDRFAFSECSNLTLINNLSSTPIALDSVVFYNTNQANCTLKVPEGSSTAYQTADVWKLFNPINVGGYSVNAIPNNNQMGSISGGESRFYSLNENVTLTANTADTNVAFIGWFENGIQITTDSIINFTVNGNRNLIATFGIGTNININSIIPGSLCNSTMENTDYITDLTITGEIDARDIQYIRDSIPYITKLDLEGANIVAYNGAKGTIKNVNTYYPANQMPSYSFNSGNPNYLGKSSLTSIVLPNSIVSIGVSAFQNCSVLSKAVFPTYLDLIGDYSFAGCSSLTHLINKSVIPIPINNNVFENVNQNLCTLVVPSGSVSEYQTADVWKYFNPIISDATMIENSLYDKSISIFPNPASNQITIEGNTNIHSIRVFDVLGNKILNSFPNNPSVLINTESMEPGIYFISIETDLGIKTQKINIIR